MKYWIFKDKAGEYRWHLDAGNNRIIASSGEGYKNELDCLHGIKLVKDSSNTPVERLNYSVKQA